MANILYRGTVSPAQPAAVAGGSAAKNYPLTNDEGDWNYKALNDDIQTRAHAHNSVLSGVTSFDTNLRSTNFFNQYVYYINGTIETAGILIGTYTSTSNTDNINIQLDLTGVGGSGSFVNSRANIGIRTNTLPDVQCEITLSQESISALSLGIEAWKNSSGTVYIYAVPSSTLTGVAVDVKVWERSKANKFVPSKTVVARSTTGQTRFISNTNKLDLSAFYVTVKSLIGNASTATTATVANKLSNPVTFNNSGSGVASGMTFDGSVAGIISYNTIGAPSSTGAGASGDWNINAVNVTGIVAIANGGTGASNAAAATSNIERGRHTQMSGSITMVVGTCYSVNASSTYTSYLPVSPTVGDEIVLFDAWSKWGNPHKVTIEVTTPTHRINNTDTSLVLDTTKAKHVRLKYTVANVWTIEV